LAWPHKLKPFSQGDLHPWRRLHRSPSTPTFCQRAERELRGDPQGQVQHSMRRLFELLPKRQHSRQLGSRESRRRQRPPAANVSHSFALGSIGRLSADVIRASISSSHQDAAGLHRHSTQFSSCSHHALISERFRSPRLTFVCDRCRDKPIGETKCQRRAQLLTPSCTCD